MLRTRRLLARVALLALVLAGFSFAQSSAASADSSPGEPGAFVSLGPTRVLDTRSGNGANGPVAANGTIHLQVLGRGGVPASGVSAVVLNVTVTAATSSGFVTVYPDGTTRPTASNLNFPAKDTRANLVTVKVGANGKIALSISSGGTVQLVADVAGYYVSGAASAAGAFVSLAPTRLLDTRSGNGAKGPVAAHGTIHVQVLGRGGVPSSGVSAVVLNVTVVAATTSGFVTVYPDGTTKPTASNLNFPVKDTRANLATVKVGANGKIALSTSSGGPVHLVADVAGYYLAGSAAVKGGFVSLAPTRVLDTRSGNGAKGPVAAHGSIHVQVAGRGGVPSSGVSAVVLNVTETGGSTPGFVTVYPDGTATPTASNLNFPAKDTRANLVTVKVGANGKIALSSSSGGPVHLVADVAGYYLASSLAQWTQPERIDPYFGEPQAVSCPTTSFCMAGDFWGGFLTFDGFSWSEPVSVDPLGSGIASISCTGPSFCMAVDWAGNAMAYDGSAWSAPKAVISPGVALNSVSCVSSVFCAAVGAEGSAVVFDGTKWSAPAHLDLNALGSVTCSSTTFCVTVHGDGDMSTFNGKGWTTRAGAVVAPGGGALGTIACPTTTFCAAVTSQGVVMTFDGTTWSPGLQTTTTGSIGWTTSCASTTSCVALNGTDMVVFNGRGWQQKYSGAASSSLSCVTSTFCMRASRDGTAATFDGERWGAPVTMDPPRGGLTFVSCPTTTFCAAADSSGSAFTYDGTTWSAPTKVGPSSYGPVAISCATETFCVVAEGTGEVATFDGNAWSAPQLVASALQDVSCPTTTFCMAVNDSAQMSTFDGTRWSTPAWMFATDRSRVTTVSCVSATFCAAVTKYGAVSVFDGSSWSYPVLLTQEDPGFLAFDVSCSSQTACVAVGSNSHAFVYDGTTWSAATTISRDYGFGQVSCVSATFCVAVNAGSGDTLASTFDGRSWTPAYVVAPRSGGFAGVSCASTSFCGVVVSSGDAVVGRWP